jgi:outer membrane receptor for ferrienterochelin and colicins
LYAGVKNLLNWTPGNPFIIARNDPLTKMFNMIAGNASDTRQPLCFNFDPGYVYGPNQGVRSFFWVAYNNNFYDK